MDLNNLERGQLKGLQNQETDFDLDAMWKNIEPQTKKRRSFFWFWSGGGASLLLLFAGLFLYNSPATSTSIGDLTNETERLNLIEVETVNSAIENTKSIVTTSSPSQKTDKPLTSSKTKIAVSKKLKTDNQIKTKTPISNNSPSNSTKTAIKEKVSFRNVETKKSLDDLPLVNQKSAEIPSIPHTKKREKKANTSDQKKEQKTTTSTLLEKLPLLSVFVKKDLKAPPIITPLKKPKFALSFFGGVGYQFKTLKLKDREFRPITLDLRNSSESVVGSFVFGMEIDRTINEQWSIGTGFELIVHSEKMLVENRTITNLDDLDRRQLPDFYIGREGYLIEVNDSTYFNHHRLLNVPIRVSYLFKYKKLRLMPEAGLVFNIFQKSGGHIKNSFDRTEELSTYFRKNIGASVRLGCKILIPTRSGFSIYARPSFEWNPNNVLAESQPIRQKRNLVRVDLGISRYF